MNAKTVSLINQYAAATGLNGRELRKRYERTPRNKRGAMRREMRARVDKWRAAQVTQKALREQSGLGR